MYWALSSSQHYSECSSHHFRNTVGLRDQYTPFCNLLKEAHVGDRSWAPTACILNSSPTELIGWDVVRERENSLVVLEGRMKSRSQIYSTGTNGRRASSHLPTGPEIAICHEACSLLMLSQNCFDLRVVIEFVKKWSNSTARYSEQVLYPFVEK